jgi:hypothetical protein
MPRQPTKIKQRDKRRKQFEQLGPFRGVDNVADETAELFEPNKRYGSFLRKAINVDLTNDGWLRRRQGATKLLSFQRGHSGRSIGGHFLVVDNGVLLSVELESASAQAEVLVTGLGHSPVSYAAAGTDVFLCNGSTCGRVRQDGTYSFWGIAPPSPPVLTATSDGNLPPGRYMVALTCEIDGVESGARPASVIELPAVGGIQVSGIFADPRATHLNVYLTDTNFEQLFWTHLVELPATSFLLTVPPTSTDMLDRLNMWPPPDGAHMVRLFNGRLLVASGKELYWSQPLAYHLFKKNTDLQQFPERIKLLAPLSDGFYVGAGDLTQWVSGDDPDSWKPDDVGDTPISEGEHLIVPGKTFPSLETRQNVAVWITADGVTVGMPGGRVEHMTEEHFVTDPHAFAALAYREEKNANQVLFNLRQQTRTTRVGMADRAFCDVVKA